MAVAYKFRWILRNTPDEYPPNGRTVVSVFFFNGEFKTKTINSPITGAEVEISEFERGSIIEEAEYAFDGVLSQADVCTLMDKELAKLGKPTNDQKTDKRRLDNPSTHLLNKRLK